MPDEAAQPIHKRRRVTVACDSCRSKKSKCDGRRPVCSRCAGYDFICTWNEREYDRSAARRSSKTPASSYGPPQYNSFHQCQHLVRQLCDGLSEVAMAEVEESLALIQTHLDQAASQGTTNSTKQHQITYSSSNSPQRHAPRYLGEVSDIQFFNLAKRTLGDVGSSPEEVEEVVDSYDQEEAIPARQMRYELSVLPDPVKAEEYLEAYFTTIHIAYPFVPKASFMRTYRSLRSGGDIDSLSPAWLGLLYALLAIGSYYTSFPRDEDSEGEQNLHMKYFLRSRHLSGYENLERSVTQVSTLLARCFYLLATSKTDRCWITLGLAIRLAQSMGLHVDLATVKKGRDHFDSVSELPEIRRRVWYSLYVLDRLLALQLGRPPAVSDEECYVSLPSVVDDMNHDWETEPLPTVSNGEKSVGEYFVRVIEFSSILGRVPRDLYHPRLTFAQKLENTRNLDEILLAWKQRLPRYLRFDVGHAFEKSMIFKRQRNILAIKFHHLRALIYRTFLGFPRENQFPATECTVNEQHSLMQCYEQICISEAQETARLLHNVGDEKELVHDYPWWQMISCLVCAGSILIVAQAILKQRSDPLVDVTTLGDDAETCLEVFEALSHNSHGARAAMGMLRKLKEQNMVQIIPNEPHEAQFSATRPNPVHQYPFPADYQQPLAAATTWHPESMGGASERMDLSWGSSVQSTNPWPLEIGDSMAWSTRVFNVLQQEMTDENHSEVIDTVSPPG